MTVAKIDQMKNLLLYSGFILCFIACGPPNTDSTEVSAESAQVVQEIEQAEAAVNSLDSINQEIQNSSNELDALLQDLN